MLALGLGEYAAAEILIEKGVYRESLTHLYFCSYYLSQAVCADVLTSKTSHKNVERQLNKKYGEGGGKIAKRYVQLHNQLHNMRNDTNYQSSAIPSEESIEKLYKTLTKYVDRVNKQLERITILDVVLGIYEEEEGMVKDFSYDIYCPKTYKHHNRITFWKPPFYLDIYTIEELITKARTLMVGLKIQNHENYVLGLNSRIDQYSNNHYLMLDFDSLDTSLESVLEGIGGVLLRSGRGYHFIGNDIIEGQKTWEKEIKRIGRIRQLKGKIDQAHIDISIKRGYSTLRITSNAIKPYTPIFYKEI